MKEKIAKLLALAMDQAGKPEGDLAAEQALRLMERYGIGEGEVKAATEENPMEKRTVKVPKSGWIYHIAWVLGSLVGVFVAAGRGQVSFYGRRTDTELAEFLLGSLRNQCQADAREWRRTAPAHEDTGRSASRTFRDSWVKGLKVKIDKVLAAQRKATARETALVPTSRKKKAENWAQTQDRFQKNPIRYRTGNSRGYRSGRSANLNSGIGGRGRAALKG